jgi:hypothetical protein
VSTNRSSDPAHWAREQNILFLDFGSHKEEDLDCSEIRRCLRPLINSGATEIVELATLCQEELEILDDYNAGIIDRDKYLHMLGVRVLARLGCALDDLMAAQH